MTTLSTDPRPIPRGQEDEQADEKDRDPVTGPIARRTVRKALQEAFTEAVDDVRLAEVDGMVHIYVSIRPTTSALPERIRATAREAYRRVVRGEPVVAHVAAPCSARGRW
ncbi:hypothetical protein ACQPZZ_12915 [Microbispora sp. CA-135349]|uniref:hypothetical protein n=1 Tax=Microbispora sp. CA-135349 TaxID=3239953 RepID=UPI003D8EAC17